MKYGKDNLYYFTEFETNRNDLTLKTFLGYILVDNIECYKDIFFGDYIGDRADMIRPYNECYADKDTKNKVKTLSLRLGKHWKQ